MNHQIKVRTQIRSIPALVEQTNEGACVFASPLIVYINSFSEILRHPVTLAHCSVTILFIHIIPYLADIVCNTIACRYHG